MSYTKLLNDLIEFIVGARIPLEPTLAERIRDYQDVLLVDLKINDLDKELIKVLKERITALETISNIKQEIIDAQKVYISSLQQGPLMGNKLAAWLAGVRR